jgi:ubiquinone/menaquinone biosynthesis C-methylase UbiE
MFSRRNFVASTPALAAGLTIFSAAQKAQATGINPPWNVEPRGMVGRLERLPQLDLESKQDFLQGLTAFTITGELAQASRARGEAIIKASGVDPALELPVEKANALLESDPVIAMRDRLWYSAHNYEHDILDNFFQRNADVYLTELEAADKAGPATLELNPSLQLPDYTRHEIHQQPGGYVGNAFAGHIYHYATNMFYRGTNDQDQRHSGYAAGCPVPKNGTVGRILDLGTGVGQLAVAMKERFPLAEVTGLDAAAPMLRYGHMRANELGVNVAFTQRLAEKTGYPDNHFDIVISYILFHEVTAEASRKIIAEAHRILRPGGIFYPMDFNQTSPPSALKLYAEWKDHHWNNERWRLEYASLNFDDAMRQAGFVVEEHSDQRSIFGRVIATKTA